MTDYFSPEKSRKRENEIASLLGRDILEGATMRRLRGVSFLGVLNIVAGVPQSLRFNRYEHSISVAYLTWCYCENLKMPKEVSLISTLLALIHDVGHPPYSHSTEIFLKLKSGVQTEHTSAMPQNRIMKVLKEGHSTLPALLRKGSLENLGKRLHTLFTKKERESQYPYVADLLDTPFCPDTFDGINRAWYALNSEEVIRKLGKGEFDYYEAIDPMMLVRFISTTSNLPYTYKSKHPPTDANLIYKFHGMMKALYDDVIYSHWQSAAMVMFARALEIAYANVKNIDYSKKTDESFTKKINNNNESARLYAMIENEKSFCVLSEKYPLLHKSVVDSFGQIRGRNTSYIETKHAIEDTIANKLKIKVRAVFCHIYNPLLWKSDNIWFKEIPQGKGESLWLLKWDSREGERDKNPRIDVYYAPHF